MRTASRERSMEQMKEQADKIELIRHKIEDADAIVIGAGAGLSTAAGFTYSGDRFEKYFSDFFRTVQRFSRNHLDYFCNCIRHTW